MDWRPNLEYKIPVYRQLANHLEQRIARGELSPGSRLFSERKLAQLLGINRSTVVKAYDELHSIGLVERTRGSGTSVSTHMWGINPNRMANWRQYVEGGDFSSKFASPPPS